MHRYDRWGDDHSGGAIYSVEFWIFVCAPETVGSEKRSRL